MSNFTKSIFWILYIISVMIEVTYVAGKVSAPYIIKGVAFVITCFSYVRDYAVIVYNNRDRIVSFIEDKFTYRYV